MTDSIRDIKALVTNITNNSSFYHKKPCKQDKAKSISLMISVAAC